MPADLTATPGNPASYKGRRAVVRHPALHTYGGKPLDVGQIFMMRGLENDDRLKRLGFLDILANPLDEKFPCRVCGVPFTTMKALNAHGTVRHEVRDTPVVRAPQASDVDHIDENSFKGVEPENDPAIGKDAPPLFLDQTAAERGVKSETINL